MRLKLNKLWLMWLATTIWLVPAITQADLVVDILDATISAGGTGSADVMISSTTGTDNLAAYAIDFNITQAGGTTTSLEFINPSDPANVAAQANQAALLSNANYVFGANGGTADATNVGSTGPATTYSAVDFAPTNTSGDQQSVIVPKTQSLLAHLDFTTATGSPPHAGDSFTISANPASPSFFDQTLDFNNPIPFTVHAGTVNITPGSAEVPEPSSLMLLAVGLGAGWYRATQRSRKQTDQ
jgi:hypothetical protein